LFNEITHETTGFTPNELHLGIKDNRFWEEVIQNPFKPTIPTELKLELAGQRIRNKQKKLAAKLNSKHKPTHFNIGDDVLIKTHPVSNLLAGETAKLFDVYQGPFKISAVLGPSTYNVCNTDNQSYGPIHVSMIKSYNAPMANS